MGLSVSLGNLFLGFVLPYEMTLGAVISSVLAMIVANPILYRLGWLPHYRLGSNALVAKLSADLDFWLSVGIGVNLAIGVIGLFLVGQTFLKARRERTLSKGLLSAPPGRSAPATSRLGSTSDGRLLATSLGDPTGPLAVLARNPPQ